MVKVVFYFDDHCNVAYIWQMCMHVKQMCIDNLCDLFVCYLTAYGSTCVSTEECVDILLMSVCKSGQCKCVPGYYYMNSTVGCLPGKNQ